MGSAKVAAAAQQAFDQVVAVDCSLFDARVAHEWARNKRYAGAPVDADEDMSEEAPTQRKSDALRMQKRLYIILRCKEAT